MENIENTLEKITQGNETSSNAEKSPEGVANEIINNAREDSRKVLGYPYFVKIQEEGKDYGILPSELTKNAEDINDAEEVLKAQINEILSA